MKLATRYHSHNIFRLAFNICSFYFHKIFERTWYVKDPSRSSCAPANQYLMFLYSETVKKFSTVLIFELKQPYYIIHHVL